MEGVGQVFSAVVDGHLDGYGGISWKTVFGENLAYVLVNSFDVWERGSGEFGGRFEMFNRSSLQVFPA